MRLLPLSLTALLVSLVAAYQSATLYIQPGTKGSSPIPYAEVSYTRSGPGRFIRYLPQADPNTLQIDDELARIGVLNEKNEVTGAAVQTKYLTASTPLLLRPTITLYTTLASTAYYVEVNFHPYDAPLNRDESSYPLPIVETVSEVQTQQQAPKPVLNKPVVLTKDGKMPQQEEEKSFIQKYWWMIAGGMLLLLVSGGSDEGAEGEKK